MRRILPAPHSRLASSSGRPGAAGVRVGVGWGWASRRMLEELPPSHPRHSLQCPLGEDAPSAGFVPRAPADRCGVGWGLPVPACPAESRTSCRKMPRAFYYLL